MISQLSHPHICTLFDVGHEDTPQGPVDYLVMEFIEGETLAVRLAKDQPVPQQINIVLGWLDELKRAPAGASR